MKETLSKKNVLITGADSGNTSNKFSFLNEKGNIESFAIPTVIAPATSSKVKLEGRSDSSAGIPGENVLHLRITSNALPADKTNSYYYVGEYAKNKDGRIEPKGVTQDKFNNELHIVTTLTGLALCAFKSGKSEVIVPYSGGLPINEFKKIGAEKVLEIFRGKHEIEAIDGAYEGKKVTLIIEDGSVHVEGVTSSLALSFDIKGNEISETKLGQEIGQLFALSDLGAGTMDLAVYGENGLDKIISNNNMIGTNSFIERMIEEISNLKDFQELREDTKDDPEFSSPYRTREDFMRKVIFPEVEKMLKDDKYEPTFKAEWAWMKGIDVTEIVIRIMKEYGETARKELNRFWAKANSEKFVLVGGGLLFGYYEFRKYKDRFIFPEKLKDAAYFTSRAYLIANYLDQLEKVEN